MACILIADDNPDLLAVNAEFLREHGHVVITVRNGDEALAALAAEPVDVLVTDVLMPDKEGIETILEVRRVSPTLPIIAISGGGHIGPVDYLAMARAAGANATLRKPVAPSELEFVINEVLRD